ncbi:MAG: helix-turn-helix domain-containing protein [Burkholderiaceae bacterium]
MKECCMPKKYKHITLEDRTLIQTQLQLGFNPAAIAVGLNRPRSCITRELARNDCKALAVLVISSVACSQCRLVRMAALLRRHAPRLLC